MDDGWSPGLIAAMLRHEHPAAAIMDRVSHETIYRALYVQTRGEPAQGPAPRSSPLKRRARKPRGSIDGRGKSLYREAFTIRQRPAEVADRAVPGHWEGDLVLGAGNALAVGTLVERSTRFVILLHLPGRHDAESASPQAMIREMSRLPEHLRRSLTWDRGTELADYRDIQLAARHAGLLLRPALTLATRHQREHQPAAAVLAREGHRPVRSTPPTDLARIAATLNARPRPTLDLQTPAQALAALLANPAALRRGRGRCGAWRRGRWP